MSDVKDISYSMFCWQ